MTLGAPDLDFTLAGGSTCTVSVTAGGTCTVNVTFAPLFPGDRRGAVEIVDGSGNLLVSTYIHGTGVGPVIAFSPSTPVTVATGLDFPNGLKVDANGNIFVADPYGNTVNEILAVNGAIPANPTIKPSAAASISRRT